MAIPQSDINNWFQYHAPKDDQGERYDKVRAAGKVFAEAILALTPSSADQTVAIRKVREAVYSANAAIACTE